LEFLGALTATTVDETYLLQGYRHDLPPARVARGAPPPERTGVTNRWKLQNLDLSGPVVVKGAKRLQSRRAGHAFRIGDLTPPGADLHAGFHREIRHRQLFRIHLAGRAFPWGRRDQIDPLGEAARVILVATIGRVRHQLRGLKSARFQVFDYYGKCGGIGLAGSFRNG